MITVRRTLHDLAPLCLLLAAACGGGGTDSMPPPADLQVAWQPTYVPALKVTWRETYGVGEGYDVECKAGDGAFTNIFGQPMVRLALPQFFIGFGSDGETMPEAVDLQYRMRYVKNGKHSDYSNVASVRAQIRPPKVQTSPQESGPAIALTWVNLSQAADTLILERGTGTSAATIGGWTSLQGPAFGVTSFRDENRPEDPWVAYRVTYAKGSDQGSRSLGAVENPLRAPSAFQAVPGMDHVDLSWANSSSLATEVVVMRQGRNGDNTTWADIAHLPLSETTYRDMNPPSTYNSYRIESRLTGRIAGKTPTLMTAAVPQPSGGLAFTTSIQVMPQAYNGERDAQGRWSFVGLPPNSRYSFYTPSGSGWALTPLQSHGNVPVVRLDSLGRAHTIYTTYQPEKPDEETLVHVWHDGTAWQQEEIGRRPYINQSQDPTFTFVLDGQDRVHAIWADSLDLKKTAIHCARKDPGGTWVRLPDAIVPPALLPYYTYLTMLHLAIAADGTPVVMANSNLLTFDSSKGWSTVAIPPIYSSYSALTDVIVEPDGRITVFALLGAELTARTYGSGVWSATETVFSMAGLPEERTYEFGIKVLVSPSGNRLGVTFEGLAGTYVSIRERGTWSTVRLGSDTGTRPMIAFDPDDRLQILHRAENNPSLGMCPYAVYNEVR